MLKDVIRSYFSSPKKKTPHDIDSISSELSESRLAELFQATNIPKKSSSWQTYAQLLTSQILPHMVKVSHPRFIGHMTSKIPEFHEKISTLVTRCNQNAVKTETSRVITFLERQCLSMMHRKIFCLPQKFYAQHTQNRNSVLGLFVSGGSCANITALWSARNRLLDRNSQLSCSERGVQECMRACGYRDLVVLTSPSAHYSIDKFASLSGMGHKNIIKVPLDRRGVMNVKILQSTIERCQREDMGIIAIVAIAGSTETGSIDNLSEIHAIARKFDIHFHVDAAWGGPVIFSRRHRHKLVGIENADSLIICGHKQLYLPQGISLVLFKEPHLAHSIATISNYQSRPDSYDAGRWGPEGSRPAMVLFLHASLHLLGEQGYEYLIDYGIDNADYMANRIRELEQFELVCTPQTNIVVYRYLPQPFRSQAKYSPQDNKHINATNKRLQHIQSRQGNSFVSHTVLCPEKYPETSVTALRAVLANPNTRHFDIDCVLREQIKIGKSLRILS